MKPLAVWLDRWVEAACPQLDQALAMRGALVLRCFERTPSPAASRRLEQYRQVVVLGGADREMRTARVELATTTLTWPVIVLSPEEERAHFGAGVVDVVRPQPAEILAQRVALMSEVPIVSNTYPRRDPAPALRLALAPPGPGPTVDETWERSLPGETPAAVAMVSSTGGSFVVAELLRAMRRPSGRAVLLAQHLEAEFVPFFAEWLAQASGWPVRVVASAEPLLPDRVYLAAGGRDLLLGGDQVRVRPAASHWVPCGDVLLESLAQAQGARGVGVILSGMGGDGSLGLAAVAGGGGRALCQAPASAVVPSMPQRALQQTPSAQALSPPELARALRELA